MLIYCNYYDRIKKKPCKLTTTTTEEESPLVCSCKLIMNSSRETRAYVQSKLGFFPSSNTGNISRHLFYCSFVISRLGEQI